MTSVMRQGDSGSDDWGPPRRRSSSRGHLMDGDPVMEEENLEEDWEFLSQSAALGLLKMNGNRKTMNQNKDGDARDVGRGDVYVRAPCLPPPPQRDSTPVRKKTRKEAAMPPQGISSDPPPVPSNCPPDPAGHQISDEAAPQLPAQHRNPAKAELEQMLMELAAELGGNKQFEDGAVRAGARKDEGDFRP